jgi:hypothetical protein
MIYGIIVALLFIIIACLGLYIYNIQDTLKQKIEKDEKIKEENIKLQKQKEVFLREEEILKNNIKIYNQQLENSQNQIENMELIAQQAYEHYCDILENNYQDIDEEYKSQINRLSENYNKIQNEKIAEAAQVEHDLDKIRNTRAAAIQAQVKEKEIKEQKEFYCLTISENDLSDIKVLERIKSQLYQPRILSMLIWQTYYQKPMTALCNRILSTETKKGIYKITNQVDGMCYIGQSVDIAKRWKDHAKCGLGIDTPASNKLYKAMQEDGLYNFSFELLEECSSDELDEKEVFFINLYDSYHYGYNSNSGNKS